MEQVAGLLKRPIARWGIVFVAVCFLALVRQVILSPVGIPVSPSKIGDAASDQLGQVAEGGKHVIGDVEHDAKYLGTREEILLRAAKDDDFKEVKEAVEAGANIDFQDDGKSDERGYTALMWASFNGDRDMVTYLLDHGANKHIEVSDSTAYDIARSNVRDILGSR